VAKTHRGFAETKVRRSPPRPDPAGYIRPWLLAAFAALCVARPLVPSEGAAWLGDDLPFDMLWLLLAGGYFLWALLWGGLARPLTRLDAPALVLLAIGSGAALVGASHGAPRLAINMLWVWVALGLLYFLARQLLLTAAEARAMVSAMVALAVALSVLGYHQVLVSLPADREAYAADPDAVLEQALGEAFPPGSPERMRFEDRLQSTEPLATFALTNSLAGYLVPWLIVGLGIATSLLVRWFQSRNITAPGKVIAGEKHATVRVLQFAVLVVALLLIAGCLLLTKGRSAYLALGGGMALLPLCGPRASGSSRRKLALIAALVLLALGGLAAWAGALDVKVFSEATKSLGYRFQYWQATVAMIGRYPWFGVGPGNFQDYYTQFKLPEASEEIRDPHNFLLEVWATSGVFALVALLATLAAVAWSAVGLPRGATVDSTADEPPGATRSVGFLLVGAAAGMFVAFLIAPLVGFFVNELQVGMALVVGAVVTASLWPWIVRGSIPWGLPALGLGVLAIQLLAAGGISYPAVAGSFWLLVALAFNQAEGAPHPAPRPSHVLVARGLPLVALVAVGASSWFCYFTGFRPVVRLQQALAETASIDHPEARIVAYMDAALADPLSSEPWIAMAQIELERLKRDPESKVALQRFLDSSAKVVELRPRSSATYRQIGHWYLEIAELTGDARTVNGATECLRAASTYYPNSAATVAEFALALKMSGKMDVARRQAQRALELDAATPHHDKKLPAELRDAVRALLEEPALTPAADPP
jgi:hypothetical protein